MSSSTLRGFAGFIFDVDGTLLDSNEALAASWREAFEIDGLAVPYLNIRRLIGMGADHLIPRLVGIGTESPQFERLKTIQQRLYQRNYFPSLNSFSGARELLEFMHEKKIRLAVASSSSRKDLKESLKKIAAESYFDEVVCSDDVSQSKPNSDIVQVARDRLKLPYDRIAMIGDTPYDIEAAEKAGIQSIALRTGGWSDHDLKSAASLFDGPLHFLTEIKRALGAAA